MFNDKTAVWIVCGYNIIISVIIEELVEKNVGIFILQIALLVTVFI